MDEIKEIYLQRVADLAPNIRYCEYNIGDESAIKDLRAMRLKGGLQDEWISSLDVKFSSINLRLHLMFFFLFLTQELIEKTQERQAATLSEVTWRGRTIPVKNEKVRVFLMGLKEFDTQLEQAEDVELKLSVYETLLKELIDAQQSVKEENKEDPVSLLFLLVPLFDLSFLSRSSKRAYVARVWTVVVCPTRSSCIHIWRTYVRRTLFRGICCSSPLC